MHFFLHILDTHRLNTYVSLADIQLHILLYYQHNSIIILNLNNTLYSSNI